MAKETVKKKIARLVTDLHEAGLIAEQVREERNAALTQLEDLKSLHVEQQAAYAETKKKLDEVTKKAAQDRSDELKTFTDAVTEAREAERKRRTAAYEAMVLYAATLRSGLLLLLRNSEGSEEGDKRAKEYEEAVKKLYEAKPPKETADALNVVCERMEGAQENGTRTRAIVATMLDQAFPKVETDNVGMKWWPTIFGAGMIGMAAYMMMWGSSMKTGAGWGGPK